MSYQPGDPLLDKYRIEKTLGQGAFGEVYLVTHLRLNVPRVVKLLRRDAPGIGSGDYADIQARFLLEGQLGARLNKTKPNPRLLQIYDSYIDEKLSLLEMEYAAGGSLAQRIQENRAENRPMAVEEAIRVAAEVAEGLAALHELDIVHRDVKPANILFDEEGHARLADLGLAQVPGGGSQRSQLSTPRPHPGTPGYMSPEQEYSEVYLNSASDVYSLGLILFEMLTGRMYTNQKPGTRPSKFLSDLPGPVDDLLAHMLAKNPEERPWDGTEAAGLLRDVLVEKKCRELIIELAPGVSMEFVCIPAGEFLMGSDPNNDKKTMAHETPQHKLYLPDYLIGKYPVTNWQYSAFVQAAGYEKPAHWTNGEIPKGKREHPVTQVNWKDASAFCAWFSKVSGQQVHLPSVAEWEKAARGTDGRIYPWGNEAPDAQRGNFNQKDTTPVGNYSPQGDSPYFCADMAGNVWEWTRTIWDNDKFKYPYKTDDGREDLRDKGQDRIMRGGSFGSGGDYSRCAYGSPDPPRFVGDRDRGFRVMLSPVLHS